jgi:hypothetical protein
MELGLDTKKLVIFIHPLISPSRKLLEEFSTTEVHVLYDLCTVFEAMKKSFNEFSFCLV